MPLRTFSAPQQTAGVEFLSADSGSDPAEWCQVTDPFLSVSFMFQSEHPWSLLPLPQRRPEEQVTDEEVVPEINPSPSSPCPSLLSPHLLLIHWWGSGALFWAAASEWIRDRRGQTRTDRQGQTGTGNEPWRRRYVGRDRNWSERGFEDKQEAETFILTASCFSCCANNFCFPWWVVGFLFYSNKRFTSTSKVKVSVQFDLEEIFRFFTKQKQKSVLSKLEAVLVLI